MTQTHALPKYVQTAEMLIREITSGRLVDGERLPPERTMAETLGLSVGTLRKALSDLEDRGLLQRIQGSGNYIRAPEQPSGVYAFFRLELLSGGGLPTAELLSVDQRAKPADAPKFGTAPHGHRIRRLRRIGGEPAALEEIWLDGGRADRVEVGDLSESLYLFYRDKIDFWIARVVDRVSMASVPEWAPAAFGPRPGETTGYVERLADDQNGETVEYSRTWFDANVASYVSRLR